MRVTKIPADAVDIVCIDIQGDEEVLLMAHPEAIRFDSPGDSRLFFVNGGWLNLIAAEQKTSPAPKAPPVLPQYRDPPTTSRVGKAPDITVGSRTLAEILNKLPWEPRGTKGYESVRWQDAQESGELDGFLKTVQSCEKFTVHEGDWTYLYNESEFGKYLGRVPKKVTKK